MLTGADGRVLGRVYAFGGPSPGRAFAPRRSGDVTLAGNGRRYTTTFNARGRFRIELPAGRYRIVASVFDGVACRGKVTVRAGEVVHASAVCPVP